MRAGVLKREVDGALLQAAFFLGSRAFYRALREMPEAERAKLRMTAVSVRQRALRRRGGQAARARQGALHQQRHDGDAARRRGVGRARGRPGRERRRRPIQLRRPGLRAGGRALDHHAARDPRRRSGERTSNIRWNYGHTTIPRHLRDIVVTEYGVADLRGKTDRDVIAAMLAVADSRFQGELLRQAKDAGKIETRLRAAGGVPRQYARAHRARAVARVRAGAAAGVSVRHRFHAGRAAADSGAGCCCSR